MFTNTRFTLNPTNFFAEIYHAKDGYNLKEDAGFWILF